MHTLMKSHYGLKSRIIYVELNLTKGYVVMNLISKSALLLTSTMFSFSALAQMPPGAGQGSANFAEHKARVLDHLNRMTQCVTQAQTPPQMKACRNQNPPPQPPKDIAPVGH